MFKPELRKRGRVKFINMKKLIYMFSFLVLMSCQSNKTPNAENNNEVSQSNYVEPVDSKGDSEVQHDKPLIDFRGTTTRYVEQDLGKDSILGIQRTLNYFEINTYLRNNTNKGIKKIIITVIFKNKYSNAQDCTSDLDSYNSEKEIDIMPGTEVNVSFTVFPKDNINMVYSDSKLERIIYNDGSYTDL